LGSAATHRKLAGDLSRVVGCGVYVLEYRLAPEHPLPAPVDDAVSGYRALLERHAAESLLLAGDSAGGTLTVLAAIRLRDAGSPMPAGLVALTPWVDYRCEDRSYTERAEGDPVTLVPELRGYGDWALDGYDATDPVVCPLSADLRDLPPMLIHGGTGDVMCNDAARLADKARSAGVDVTHRQVPEMMHVWHVFAGRVPEATEAVDDIGSFARRRFTH
jgi:monoterpene epsilon-lactone hydrolase